MLTSFKRLGFLIWKELVAILSDKTGRIVLFIPPILQLVIFSFAISQEVKNARIAVLNMDAGAEGSALIKSFYAKPVFKELVRVKDYGELNKTLENQRVLAGIVIPQDYSRRSLSNNENPTIQIILDGRRANGSGIIGSYISQIVMRNESSFLNKSSGIIVRRWFNPNLAARVSFMPGLVCLMMTTVGMISSATSIARERELGSYEQLVVSPFTPLEIVAGKTIAAVFLATISALLMLALVVFGFRSPLSGPFWLFLLSTILYLTSIVCSGLFISSLSKTQQQATLGIFLFMPPAVLLSGFATPVENMPEWLQIATIPNPVRWELIALKGLLARGTSVRVIIPNLVPLALAAFITFSLAVIMFKKRME